MIKSQLKKIIKKISNKKISISDDKDLIASQVLDSLSIMILISEIEKQFKIKIKMSKFSINNCRNINNLVKFIKINEKNSK